MLGVTFFFLGLFGVGWETFAHGVRMPLTFLGGCSDLPRAFSHIHVILGCFHGWRFFFVCANSLGNQEHEAVMVRLYAKPWTCSAPGSHPRNFNLRLELQAHRTSPGL